MGITWGRLQLTPEKETVRDGFESHNLHHSKYGA